MEASLWVGGADDVTLRAVNNLSRDVNLPSWRSLIGRIHQFRSCFDSVQGGRVDGEVPEVPQL